jgi:hypothetical protein
LRSLQKFTLLDPFFTNAAMLLAASEAAEKSKIRSQHLKGRGKNEDTCAAPEGEP